MKRRKPAHPERGTIPDPPGSVKPARGTTPCLAQRSNWPEIARSPTMAVLSAEAARLPSSAPLREGHYTCQRCAACCRWPGEVVLADGETEKIARFLGLSETGFIDRHTTLRANRQGLTLTMQADGACSMLEGNSCRIQPVKPAQCAGFPNAWRFPGWEKLCEARLEDRFGATSGEAAGES